MAFSVGIELLNVRVKKKKDKGTIQLNKNIPGGEFT